MAQKLQHPNLTPAQFEFELRDHRAMAYNEYIRFQEERKQRKAAFDAAQCRRCALSRWWHARIQACRDNLDNKHEAELLHEVKPNL